ncbi:uncharacterized protein SPSC_02072 [Sporisorium scitamineum]|uniref:Uncharacterized protein n=1 Tax=Sporisorium scitamineum TaxID=49012 RepID=A0A0F7S9D8_9BASI|nr:uncharacterized protein SPSC_02072 [Sporisorium scitamineum]CDW98014.1 hypothetical protein [Sporisorium scitamineum]
MHPAVVIFLSVVVVQAIAALGKQRLEDILWFGYISIFQRRTLTTQRTLRREIYTTKQQLAATSSQDQFAKWAKLRRKVDKSLADLERTNSTLSSSRTTFNMLLKGFLFVLTTVMPFCVTSWYSKTPIFWLPPGEHSWFGPLGWFLALPRAPRGAVSSTVWQMVCSRSLIALGGALAGLIPGKEVVLNEEKIQELQEKSAKGTSTSAPATGRTAAASGEPRKRTNAGVSEKQDL